MSDAIPGLNADEVVTADLSPHDRETLDLDAIEARANAATPGPWNRATPSSAYLQCPRCDQGEYVVKTIASSYGPQHHDQDADADFIAAARADVLALVAEVRAVMVARDNAEAAITRAHIALDEAEERQANRCCNRGPSQPCTEECAAVASVIDSARVALGVAAVDAEGVTQ